MYKNLYCCDEYLVSDQGYVLSKSKKHKLKPSINHNGYQIINIMMNGKRIGMSVHVAVARTFLDGYIDGLQVNHINGNKLDNRVENLEFVTSKENIQHSINVLGHNKHEENAPSFKRVYVYDKNSLELKYEFQSLSETAKYFADSYGKNIKSTLLSIWRVLNNYYGHKTYLNYIFSYTPI